MRRFGQNRRNQHQAQVDLAQLDKAALVKYARQKGVPATSRWNRETIIEHIEAL